jgi:diadenosine tetraphosphate (Ap4A) HIT family hydrolase
MAEFRLDPAFAATSHRIGDLPLCEARLQDDARYPWIVLIPRVASLTEIEQLSDEDRVRLMDEMMITGQVLRLLGPVDKLNFGALGNVTAQLHVHAVGRTRDDPAWPGPVWGHSPAVPYDPEALEAALAKAREALGL